MAGGKGTRIAGLYSDIPKPMIPVAGRPVLEHQLNVLKAQGLTEVILCIGHLGHIIREHFGNGSALGMQITYAEEHVPLGTAGALFYLRDILTEDFLLLNGDLIFDIDIARFADYHREHRGLATLYQPLEGLSLSVTVLLCVGMTAAVLLIGQFGTSSFIYYQFN